MNKSTAITAIVFILGGFVGWLIWGDQKNDVQTPMVHENGSMSMSNMMHSMNANLIDKEGNAFDEEFIKEMIVHHEGAVDMAKLVLQKSKRPELLKLANDIITAQTSEISQMKKWQAEWFGAHH